MPTLPQPNRMLDSWIGRLARDLTPDGSISRLELWHTVDGEGGDRLLTIDMEDRSDDEDPSDLVHEIWSAAFEDSQTRPQGTSQRYVVQVFRGSETIAEESKAFLVAGTAITSLIGSSSEPPTTRGQLAQEMRQTDNLHAMLIRLCESTAGQTAQMLQAERTENQGLRQQLSRVFELEQELLDRKEEREERRREREASEERLAKLMEMGMSLLPMIATKLLTPKEPAAPAMPPAASSPASPAGNPSAGPPPSASAAPSPGGAGMQATGNPASSGGGPKGLDLESMARGAARDRAVGALLSTMNSEQIQAFIENLDVSQSMALMELYSSYREEQMAQKSSQPAKSHEKPNGQTSPIGTPQPEEAPGPPPN